MNSALAALLLGLLAPATLPAAGPLYAREGTDPTFEAVLRSGAIKPGERFSPGPVPGSRVVVNHELLERQVGKPGPIPEGIRIHTQGSGAISRKDFGRWTRWYQEDGGVQVFRLFEGEQNVRDGSGKDGSLGRIEAFTGGRAVAPGAWHEWEGTYTFVRPVRSCIFQLMHQGGLWAFHIDVSGDGDVHFLRRRPVPGLERKVLLAEGMAGKSLSIKVRANGEDYEVYQRAPRDEGPWRLVAKGSYDKAQDGKVSFRWGMYVGSQKGLAVPNDGLLFVTGVAIR